jgi:hypothetical protein
LQIGWRRAAAALYVAFSPWRPRQHSAAGR